MNGSLVLMDSCFIIVNSGLEAVDLGLIIVDSCVVFLNFSLIVVYLLSQLIVDICEF